MFTSAFVEANLPQFLNGIDQHPDGILVALKTVPPLGDNPLGVFGVRLALLDWAAPVITPLTGALGGRDGLQQIPGLFGSQFNARLGVQLMAGALAGPVLIGPLLRLVRPGPLVPHQIGGAGRTAGRRRACHVLLLTSVSILVHHGLNDAHMAG